MKPFEVGKTYKNKNGGDVRIICTNRKSETGMVLVGLRDTGECEVTQSYQASGRWWHGIHGTSLSDLVPEKETRTGWINVYPGNDSVDAVYPNKIAADRGASHNRIACIEITYEF